MGIHGLLQIESAAGFIILKTIRCEGMMGHVCFVKMMKGEGDLVVGGGGICQDGICPDTNKLYYDYVVSLVLTSD